MIWSPLVRCIGSPKVLGIYNQKEYIKDRKTYLEKRCINDGGMCHIRLYNENNWHDSIFGDIVAHKNGDMVVFSFQENSTYGTSDKNYHTVMAHNITKQVVEKICLDFENCESFMVFKDEILDMQINCKKQLQWNSSSYGRELSNGFIRLKLDNKFTWRQVHVHNCDNKTPNVKILERRICGDGEDEIDICNLYINYRYAGYDGYEEQIYVEDIRPKEEIELYEEENGFESYISGYAKRESDNSILIVFGKKREK